MTKYVDVDAILKKLPNDLPYKASVKRVLMQAEGVEVKYGEWKQGVPYVCSICGKPASEEKTQAKDTLVGFLHIALIAVQ